MNPRKCVPFVLLIFIVLIAAGPLHAQLLKKIVKTEGGGGSDIVQLISNIPDEAQVLVSINLENFVKTDLFGMAKEAIGEDINVVEQMGINLQEDLKHLILGVTFEDEPSVYGVLAGNFEANKIMNLAEESGAEVQKMKIASRDVYAVEDLFLSFTDDGVLFAGSDAGGKDVMTKMLNAGQRNLANNPQMVNLVKDTNTAATAWAAFMIPDKVREGMAREAGEELPFDANTMRMANLSVDYGKLLKVEAGLFFDNDKEPGKLVSFLKDQIAATAEMEGIPPEIKDLIGRLNLEADGKVARGSISVEAEKIMGLFEMIAMPPSSEEWEEEEDDEWVEDEGDDESEEEIDLEEDLGEEEAVTPEDEEEDQWSETKKEVEKALEEIEEGKIDLKKLKGLGK